MIEKGQREVIKQNSKRSKHDYVIFRQMYIRLYYNNIIRKRKKIE